MIPIIICLVLNRCTTLHPKLPSIAHPNHWGQPCKTGHMDYHNFWRHFNDPNIDRLVAFALAQNPDLIKTKHRIIEARALYNSALVNVILPQSSINLQTMHGQNPMLFRQDGDSNFTQQQFELSWELDVLGKKTKKAKAGTAVLRKTVLEYKAIERLLIVDVITAYVDIQLQKQLLQSAEKTIKTCEDQIRLVSAKDKAGLEVNHAVEEWQTQMSKTEQNKAQILHALTAAKNRLAVLIGCLPHQLEGILHATKGLPVFDAQIILGKPLTVMQKRPDVLAAEQAVSIAHHTMAAELSRLWPNVTLSSVMGRNQIGSEGFSKISSFGLNIFQPLLDIVRIHSDVKAKKAKKAQSIQGYVKTVLQAYEEVENTLSAYQSQRKQALESATLVKIQKRLYEQNEALFKQGLNSKVEVNTQQIQWLNALQSQSIISAAVIKAQLQLIKAAGY